MKLPSVAVNFLQLSRNGASMLPKCRCPIEYRLLSLRSCSTSFASTDPSDSAINNTVDIQYQNGLPVFTLLLPSRIEKCRFTLRPVSQTIGDFSKFIMTEDKGVDRVAFYHSDGTRLSSSTYIEQLLQLPKFEIIVNNRSLRAEPPPLVTDSKLEDLARLGEVKGLIASLHSSLNIEEHKIGMERRLIGRREELLAELAPLMKQKEELLNAAEKSTSRLLYLGLGLMGAQFGFLDMLEGAISVVSESIEMTLDAQRMFILARLTWFEYSWDIMEPITYFTTYATVIAGFAYYVATRQSYEYPLAKERQLWILFHRKAKKSQFDTVKYDRLVEEIRMVESELRRLRDPLFLHLPIGRLQSLHGDLVKDNENITN